MIERYLVDSSDDVSEPSLEKEVFKKFSTVNETIRDRLEAIFTERGTFALSMDNLNSENYPGKH